MSVSLSDSPLTSSSEESSATITLGGGCFWCLEAVYEQVQGVLHVEPGYANGSGGPPSYEQVCTGRTGYNEVVQLRFDESVLPPAEVLRIFFAIHDPTTLNRQGFDVGTQYRSGIYWSDAAHEPIARQVLAEAQAAWDAPLVTELLPLQSYFTAEAYHHHYFVRNPEQGYCARVVAPKVEAFQRAFARHAKRAPSGA